MEAKEGPVNILMCLHGPNSTCSVYSKLHCGAFPQTPHFRSILIFNSSIGSTCKLTAVVIFRFLKEIKCEGGFHHLTCYKLKSNSTNVSVVNEQKASLESETTIRVKVIGENRTLQQQLHQLKEQLNEEQDGRSELQRLLSTATNDAALWRQKYESGEGNVRPEEVEELKKAFILRIQEGEAQLEAAVGKVVALEKLKAKSQLDIEALLVEVEKVLDD